jgi:hypothetical protein
MLVRIEFYGIPRRRAKVASATLEFEGEAVRMGEVLLQLTQRYPGLSDCLDGEFLRSGFSANLGGRQFTTDPNAKLCAGESLLLMSSDAGG